MELIERNQFLDKLSAIRDNIMSGTGHTVLLAGEAGIGKTVLIERFLKANEDDVSILLGACDALFTPRPLGALYDIAHQLQDNLLTLLENETDRRQVFAAFLDELLEDAPKIVVFEDLHWADEATLDLIKFIGRRIVQTKAMLILSFRDDEIGRNHPLRVVLGELPRISTTRITLPHLSEAAVAELARAKHKSGTALYSATGGNPFFVTEILESGEEGVPATVADAVLARASRLQAKAREVLEIVSCVPGRCNRWLFQTILGDSTEALDQCIDMGILRSDVENVFFRHELARIAIENALPTGKHQNLHARILDALHRNRDTIGIARLVHHATSAGDREAVLKYAPLAAKQAASLRAHREAALHYATALRYADSLSPEEQAELQEGRSYECYLTEQLDEAFAAQRAAHKIWQQLGKPIKEGNSARWLSRISWFLGRKMEAERYAARAIEILQPLPHGPELAMAYSNLAQLHMLANETEAAVQWGEQAIEMAESLGEKEIHVHALNNVGSAFLIIGDSEHGEPRLKRSLEIALENEFEEHAARAYTNLSSSFVRLYKFDVAKGYLDAGIAYCEERDLDSWALYMKAWLALQYHNQGRWVKSEEVVQSVLDTPRLSTVTKIPALAVLGALRVRRGDPDVGSVLDEAKELAFGTKELQRIAPVAIARAEAAWLNGKLHQCLEETKPAYDLALERQDRWLLGELAFWMWRAGALQKPPENAARPYALQITGDWRGAAELWEKIGCPYNKAMAMTDGNKNAKLDALKILRELGANPAAEIVERQLRELGVRNIPRGPRQTTQTNPAGLTTREMEVLPMLTDGLQNKEIADTLHISPKTVDHHISSILSKLNVHSRAKAVTAAQELGIISPK